jgi:hypothetical protein
MPLPDRMGIADPDVHCAPTGWHLTPVALGIAGGIENLDETYRTASNLGDKWLPTRVRRDQSRLPLPIVIAELTDQVRGRFPRSEQRCIGSEGRA